VRCLGSAVTGTMSWWGRPKQRKEEPDRPQSTDLGRWHDLWKLTALPRCEFDATYGDLWSRTENYFSPDPAESFQDMMILTHAAMRVRQSQILPKRIATEDATRLAELMTFVLAVAIVLRRVEPTLSAPRGSSSEFVKHWANHLLHPTNFQWIMSEPVACEELCRCLDRSANSELHALIGLAQQRLLDLDETPTESTSEPMLQSTVPRTEVSKSAKGWRYLHWLRAAIEDGEIEINKPNSAIHTLPAAETFLIVPAAFEEYAELQSESAKRIQNQVSRLGIHRVVDGHNLFKARLVGRSVRGIILTAGAALWTQVPAPSAELRLPGRGKN
jgi:hypothetical protein